MGVFDGGLSLREIGWKTRTGIAYMYLTVMDKQSYWIRVRFKVEYVDLIDEAFKTTLKLQKAMI